MHISQKVKSFRILFSYEKKDIGIVYSPLGSGGNDFCVISQAGGVTAKLQEPGWGYIQGGDDFRQLSRGGTALS